MNLRNDFLQMERECQLLADGASPEVQEVLQRMANDFGKRADDSKPQGITAMKVILITLAVLAAYLPTAYWLKINYTPVVIAPKVDGRIIQLHQPFTAFGEFGVIVPDNWFGRVADSSDDRCRSPVTIYENDTPLGPPHSTQTDIATKGEGRFLHWRSSDAPMIYSGTAAFVFSPSDKTDPRTNGRRYWAVEPEGATPDETACPEVVVAPEKPPNAFPVSEIEPMPNGKLIIKLQGPFETFGESHMAVASYHLDALADLADDPNNEKLSPIVIYEDYRPLGPSHSNHGDIASIGNGRFSHWKTQGMVFSTSDNSDPNTNGRRYWAVIP